VCLSWRRWKREAELPCHFCWWAAAQAAATVEAPIHNSSSDSPATDGLPSAPLAHALASVRQREQPPLPIAGAQGRVRLIQGPSRPGALDCLFASAQPDIGAARPRAQNTILHFVN